MNAKVGPVPTGIGVKRSTPSKIVDISHEQEYPSAVLHPKAGLEPLRPRKLATVFVLEKVEYCPELQLERSALPQ